MKSIYLKIALIGFISGIGIFYFLPTFPSFWCFILLGIIVVFTFIFRNKKYLKLLFIFLCFLILSSIRVNLNNHVKQSQLIDFYNDTQNKVTLKGYICAEPDLRTDKGKYTICAQKINFWNNSQLTQGKVLISVKRYPEYQYGDTLLITGNLKSPAEFEDFSYREYLSRYQIFSVMYYPEIQNLETNQGNRFLAKLFEWKKSLENRINRIFLF